MDEEEKKMRKLAAEADERDWPSNPRAMPKAGELGSEEGYVPLLLAGILKRSETANPHLGPQYSMQTASGAFATDSLEAALKEAKKAFIPPKDEPADKPVWGMHKRGVRQVDDIVHRPPEELKKINKAKRERWEKWREAAETKLLKAEREHRRKYPAT